MNYSLIKNAILYFCFLSTLLCPVILTAQNTETDTIKIRKSYYKVEKSLTPVTVGLDFMVVVKEIIGIGLEIEGGYNFTEISIGEGINFSRNSFFEPRSRSLLSGALFLRIGDQSTVQLDAGLRTAFILSITEVTDGFIGGGFEGPFMRINLLSPILNPKKTRFLSIRCAYGKTDLIRDDVERGAIIDFTIRSPF